MKIIHRGYARYTGFQDTASIHDASSKKNVHANQLASALASEVVMVTAQASAHAAAEASRHAQASASSLATAKRAIVDEVIQSLQKVPESPTDLITLKYAKDLNEVLYNRVSRERKEALSKYEVAKPIQYIFLQSSTMTGDRQADGVHQLNVGEAFYWPTKATIVSVSVQHSGAGKSTLRMFTYATQNSRVDIAESDTAPYTLNKLRIDIPAETKVWFSVATSKAIPTVTVVLGVVFHPIDLVTSAFS